MRFTIARERLQEALTSVASAVPTKTTLPVLSNILVEATDRGLRLSGTDLDVAVSVEVPAEVESPGALTLPAKRLGEIARELPPAPVKVAALGEQRADDEHVGLVIEAAALFIGRKGVGGLAVVAE